MKYIYILYAGTQKADLLVQMPISYGQLFPSIYQYASMDNYYFHTYLPWDTRHVDNYTFHFQNASNYFDFYTSVVLQVMRESLKMIREAPGVLLSSQYNNMTSSYLFLINFYIKKCTKATSLKGFPQRGPVGAYFNIQNTPYKYFFNFFNYCLFVHIELDPQLHKLVYYYFSSY